MSEFNPNDIGVANGNFFGLPCNENESEIVLLSVPWDATVSYGTGTADGPQAIIDASLQVDLFDEKVPESWKTRAWTIPVSEEIYELSSRARQAAEDVIAALEEGAGVPEDNVSLQIVNNASEKLNKYVEEQSGKYLSAGKLVAVVGGEHSVPFGLIKTLGERYNDFGVLHLDAHSDTRKAYEGFKFSHASIMYNVLENVPSVSKIVQVGIRDYCSDEHQLIFNSERVAPYTDFIVNQMQFMGRTWDSICDEIISNLPDNVYISFDIDALTPENCPNTGTPVPGGLTFAQADYLIYKLSISGKRIIGFDLCEVAPAPEGEWDANVGARILYKLLVYTAQNRKSLIFAD
ncbi:MAG: agmatinase family protein [Bacteroidales bacterium]|nr:agmatinase family protein [Bacteroidales bacterium]